MPEFLLVSSAARRFSMAASFEGNFLSSFFYWCFHWPYLVVQVYKLITCVRRANENAGNLISRVQFLINIFILKTELRISDFQHFHWLAGHRLSALTTHWIISACSHWIKLITWYKIGWWLSDDIPRPIWYPSSDFISTEGKPRKEQTFTLNFESVKGNRKKLLQKPLTDK